MLISVWAYVCHKRGWPVADHNKKFYMLSLDDQHSREERRWGNSLKSNFNGMKSHALEGLVECLSLYIMYWTDKVEAFIGSLGCKNVAVKCADRCGCKHTGYDIDMIAGAGNMTAKLLKAWYKKCCTPSMLFLCKKISAIWQLAVIYHKRVQTIDTEELEHISE